MTQNLIARTPSAPGYPLLIRAPCASRTATFANGDTDSPAPLRHKGSGRVDTVRRLVVLTPGEIAGGAEKAVLRFVKDYVDKGFVSKHALLLKVKAVEAIDKTNKVALRQKHL